MIGVATLLTPIIVLACGVCIEDKVAVVYDHDVIQRAQSEGQIVVFCDVQGTIAPERARDVMATIPGVQARSIRISKAPVALSFAVDPAILSPEAAIQRAETVSGSDMKLIILRTSATPR